MRYILVLRENCSRLALVCCCCAIPSIRDKAGLIFGLLCDVAVAVDEIIVLECGVTVDGAMFCLCTTGAVPLYYGNVVVVDLKVAGLVGCCCVLQV